MTMTKIAIVVFSYAEAIDALGKVSNAFTPVSESNNNSSII